MANVKLTSTDKEEIFGDTVKSEELKKGDGRHFRAIDYLVNLRYTDINIVILYGGAL